MQSLPRLAFSLSFVPEFHLLAKTIISQDKYEVLLPTVGLFSKTFCKESS